MKQNLIKFSIISLIVGVVIIALAYFICHFVTDQGITLVWRLETEKPILTLVVASLGVLFVWGGVSGLIASKVFFNEK
ncbi:MAG: hypothetical protein J6R37_00235 [Clostridia bacterium]|nr:hypothetical protein [Clostridia bacterium]